MKPPPVLLQTHGLLGERNGLPLWGPLDLRIQSGEAWHLRGANGAGKTTLLRTLAGLRPPLAGRVLHEARQGGIAWLGHQDGWTDDLDALSNLQLFADLHGLDTTGLPALMDELQLPRAARPMRQLSAGQRRKVSLARLRLQPARLWLLDEPFDALDANTTQWLSLQAHAHLHRGGALMLSSHQALPTGFPPCRTLDLLGRLERPGLQASTPSWETVA